MCNEARRSVRHQLGHILDRPHILRYLIAKQVIIVLLPLISGLLHLRPLHRLGIEASLSRQLTILIARDSAVIRVHVSVLACHSVHEAARRGVHIIATGAIAN